MQHSSVNVNVFVEELRKALSARIDKFATYVQCDLQNNPEKCQLKSRRQWLLEYRKWTSPEGLDKILLEYLTDERINNENS